MKPFMRTLSHDLVKRHVCSSCRRALGLREFHHTARTRDDHTRNYIARPGDQASPLAGYYADLLDGTASFRSSGTRIPSAPLEVKPKSDLEERQAKARLVFGSRLAGPIERRKTIESQSTLIAGIMVPPKPLEPDNCCMSGCVNCVWDQYRDDIEDWAAKSNLARERMSAQRKESQRKSEPVGTGSMSASSTIPSGIATSMDDDGGGSEALWGAGSSNPEDLFEGIPVGIREFMKTEKNLQSKHRAEQARIAG